MKTSATIFLLSIFGLYAFAQTSQFVPSDYPTDKYKVDTITTNHRDFKIRLITAKDKQHLNSYEHTKIWFHQITSDNKVIEKYLGETDTEYGFYMPNIQPLTNYFVLVECGEANGTVNLIDTHGQWISVSGYYFAVDSAQKYFVTIPSGDGLYTVSKVDLTTKEIETKQATAYSDPWTGNYQYYRATNDDWIK